jgi:hypothetical protein
MTDPLQRVGWQIVVFEAVDEVPEGRRFVAHAFDRRGQLQVATQVGATADGCATRLTAFLTTQIARNTTPGAKAAPPLERSAEMRRRSLLAAEARRARSAHREGRAEARSRRADL